MNYIVFNIDCFKELSFFNEKIENLVVREANFFVKATLRPDIYEYY